MNLQGEDWKLRGLKEVASGGVRFFFFENLPLISMLAVPPRVDVPVAMRSHGPTIMIERVCTTVPRTSTPTVDVVVSMFVVVQHLNTSIPHHSCAQR